jgi:hypothetical protein
MTPLCNHWSIHYSYVMKSTFNYVLCTDSSNRIGNLADSGVCLSNDISITGSILASDWLQ